MRYVVRKSDQEDWRSGDPADELVRINDDGTEYVVWIDGGESEDMYLRRDLGAFVNELKLRSSEGMKMIDLYEVARNLNASHGNAASSHYITRALEEFVFSDEMEDRDEGAIERWIDVLRNGGLAQTPGVFKYQEMGLPDAYCCLGVLAEKVTEVELRPSSSRSFGGCVTDNLGVHSSMSYDDSFSSIISMEEASVLTEINDRGGSFALIADVIETGLRLRQGDQEGGANTVNRPLQYA